MFILPTLSGCGKSGVSDNHGYGYFYDSVGAYNLRLRHAENQPDPTIDNLTAVYSQVAACMGLDPNRYPSPLVVIITTPLIAANGTERDGGIFFDTDLILVSSGVVNTGSEYPVYRHEFVHHFLMVTGDLSADNLIHMSTFFISCVSF